MQHKLKYALKPLWVFLVDCFHQSQHLGYRLLKRGHLLYQYEIVKHGKTFELYAHDFLAEVHNFSYKNPSELAEKSRIHSKVVNIFTLRPDLIRQYFNAETFDFKSYKQLLADFDTSVITTEQPKPIPIVIEMPAPAPMPQPIPAIDREAQLAKVRTESLKYESGEKQPKHIGHRMFGFLIRAGYFTAYNDEQRYKAWREFTGIEQRPEMSFLRDPEYNKNSTNKEKLTTQLKQVKEFFDLVDFNISFNDKKRVNGKL